MARTDWTMNDTVMPEDMNQIGEEINQNAQGIQQLQQTVNAHLNEKATDDVHGLLSDGKIIEEVGSNANGNYLRFADGTQICYGSVSFTTTGEFNYREQFDWTYPASFNQRPNVFIQHREIVSGGVAEMRYSLINVYNHTNNTTARFWLYDSEKQFTSGKNMGPFRVMAIGRWK